MRRNKLYGLIMFSCMIGYAWLLLNSSYIIHSKFEVCIIKHVTGIPCPSCGSTRAVLAILDGNFLQSILLNPIGIILLMLLLTLPVWVMYDLIYKKLTLQKFYINFELFLRKKPVAIISILLISANWIWNIYKNI